MELINGPPARALLRKTELLPLPGLDCTVLDNACGAGCVTAVLLRDLEKDGYTQQLLVERKLKITCADIEPRMVQLALQRIRSGGWGRLAGQQRVGGWEKITSARLIDSQSKVGLLVPGLKYLN